MQKKKNSSIYIAAFLLFAAGLGFMIWSAVGDTGTYHLKISEAVNLPSGKATSARICGVAGKDIVKPENGLGADFTIRDFEQPDKVIKVTYRGVLPDTFGPESEVIIEGKLENSVFTAKTLMTKCPSKYEKSNRESNGKI